MADIKVENAKKYLKAIKACKQKHVTCDLLSKEVGIYPDIIANDLSFFNPIIPMDSDFELREIYEPLKQFVEEHDQVRKVPRKLSALAKTKYKSVNDFVFQKFVVGGGLIDRNIILSDEDLKELKRVVSNDIKLRKKKKIDSLFID